VFISHSPIVTEVFLNLPTLKHELQLTRTEFTSLLHQVPWRTVERERERAAVTRRVQEKDSIERLSQLKKLENQGLIIASVDGN